MGRKVYYIAAVTVLIGMAGLVGAQVSGTKPAGGRVVAVKQKSKQITVEQRIMNLAKAQAKIVAELKVLKENQAQILQNQTQILEETHKIFTRMKRK